MLFYSLIIFCRFNNVRLKVWFKMLTYEDHKINLTKETIRQSTIIQVVMLLLLFVFSLRKKQPQKFYGGVQSDVTNTLLQ